LMSGRSRFLVPSVAFVLAAFTLTCADSARGQSSGGSIADMGLQMLQGLSSDQRGALMQQFGLGSRGTMGAQGALGSREDQAQEEQLNFMLQQQRDAMMDAEKQRAELDRLSPFLQGEDWIIITIDTSPLAGEAAKPVGAQAPSLGKLASLAPS